MTCHTPPAPLPTRRTHPVPSSPTCLPHPPLFRSTFLASPVLAIPCRRAKPCPSPPRRQTIPARLNPARPAPVRADEPGRPAPAPPALASACLAMATIRVPPSLGHATTTAQVTPGLKPVSPRLSRRTDPNRAGPRHTDEPRRLRCRPFRMTDHLPAAPHPRRPASPGRAISALVRQSSPAPVRPPPLPTFPGSPAPATCDSPSRTWSFPDAPHRLAPPMPTPAPLSPRPASSTARELIVREGST